jgi:membrane associated rhomboid family serine protease
VGIYDRDYLRQPQRSSGPSPYLPRTAIGALIAVNVAVWVADLFFGKPTAVDLHNHVLARSLSDFLALKSSSLAEPWLWWQFLTAGFTHTPATIWHLVGNMFVLYMFGREVEYRYGTKEFLRVYLVMLVFANVVWCLATKLSGGEGAILGASGAIAGVLVLFAFNFPHVTILAFFVIPMPAWVFGVLVVLYDIYGAMARDPTSHVAYLAHVAGAAFGAVYYLQGWNFSRWSLRGFRRSLPTRRKTHLEFYDPDGERPQPPSDLQQQVDRILEKIYREGEASLTAEERHTLEAASREYQRRGKG